MDERSNITLRLLLEEIKKDLPPFKVGMVFETIKSIYPPSSMKRWEKNIIIEDVEITKPLAVSKKSKELFRKDRSVLSEFYADYKKGDLLKVVSIKEGKAFCENVSIKKEYKERYYNQQLVEITLEDIISGNIKQLKRNAIKYMEELK
jgi:hypothetical protein